MAIAKPLLNPNSEVCRSFRDLTPEELADPEFLTAPHTYQFRSVTNWDDLFKSDRIMLLSEGGTGKTHECTSQVKKIVGAGGVAFFIPLEELAQKRLPDILSPDDERLLQTWRSDEKSVAIFFLDSIDEMQLSHGKFHTALRNLNRDINGQLARAKIVVTSRPIAIDLSVFKQELPIPALKEPEKIRDAATEFEELITGEARKAEQAAAKATKTEKPIEPWRTVALLPLSGDEIKAIIIEKGVKDADALLAEIDRKRVWDFARRPQDLIEICAYWQANSSLGNRIQQIEQNIISKLVVVGVRKATSILPDDKAMEGAERIALGLALTRKKSIRLSDNSLDDQETDIALDPAIILSDWSATERNELLERPIFGISSYGRVRFHHRSVFEFLAAKRLFKLLKRGFMTISACKRLIFANKYGLKVILPSMRPVAVWLSQWDDRIRSEVLFREPEALMDDGDPESFTIEFRGKILVEFVSQYGEGNWRGIRLPYDQVRRFADPSLSSTVKELWTRGFQNCDVKALIIQLIKHGQMSDCLDIARAVAYDPVSERSDRVAAVSALAAMDVEENMVTLVASILENGELWPNYVKSNLLEDLFPAHMSVDQFCQLLSQLETRRGDFGGVHWHFSGIVQAIEKDPATRLELQDGVANLILHAAKYDPEHWPYYRSRLAHLSEGLAAICCLDLKQDANLSPVLLRACVIASRFDNDECRRSEAAKELELYFDKAPAGVRAALYQAESGFFFGLVPMNDSTRPEWMMIKQSIFRGLYSSDFEWIVSILRNPARTDNEQSVAFWLAVRLCRGDEGWINERVTTLRAAVGDKPILASKFEDYQKPFVEDPEVEKYNLKSKARKRAWDKKEAKRIADWKQWREDVVSSPHGHFEMDRVNVTISDLWKVLKQAPGQENRRTKWDKSIIAKSFSGEVADLAETAFQSFWRRQRVLLPFERSPDERDTTLYVWLHGLAGLYSEAARDPEWASKLTSQEAETASRYIIVETDGIPAWADQLVKHWPAEMDATIGEALSFELNTIPQSGHSFLLSAVSRASEVVQRFFQPRIWRWLRTFNVVASDEHEQARIYQELEVALAQQLRLQEGRRNIALLELAKSRVRRGVGQSDAVLWINTILKLRPADGVDELRNAIGKLTGQQGYDFAKRFFAAIGAAYSTSVIPEVNSNAFAARHVLELLIMAYHYIKRIDDVDRSEGGTYSPDARDNAQTGRSHLLNALLGKSGSEAWQAKIQLSQDPLFDDFKDRMLHIARMNAATEAESAPISDSQVRQIDKIGELAPADRDGMFQLMLDRLADLQHDLSHHELNEKNLLATISKETMMQQTLAKRLAEKANDAYKVDREAEVVDGKKTDIRLISTRGNQQAVIELKLGDKMRSANDLRTALRDQLVGQYMRHDNCKAGCLLITLAKPRTWKHPKTTAKLEFHELVAYLHVEAEAVCIEMGGHVRVAVVGLDLRSVETS